MNRGLVTLGIILFCYPAFAGQFNKTLSIGDNGPDFNNLDGADGKTHSLSDLKDKDVVVICFTCSTCPYAVDYEDRLIALTKKFEAEGGKAAIIAINPNLVQDDLLPAMQERAKKKGFNFIYIHDASRQQIAKSYGATYTPEFVVLNKARKVVYMGAMDDSPDGKNVTTKYVEDAVAATLAGKKPAVAETPAVGCAVRYAKERGK